jgi:Flp pilus assembly protein TadD
MSIEPPAHPAKHALMLARTYADAGNYRRASEVLGMALTQDPQNPALLTQLAMAQHLLGDNAAAERSARRALDEDPESAPAMRIYAETLDALGRKPEGLRWARRAVDVDPVNHRSHYVYASLLLNADDPVGAMPAASESLRLAPHNANAHNLMGLVLSELGRRAESDAEYREALRLDPGHAIALHNIAVNQANARKFRGALAGFRRAAAVDPNIGDTVRAAITATVQKWLGWTVILAWLALQFAYRLEEGAGASDSAARIAGGCGAVALLLMCGWLAYSLPRHTWRSMLFSRQRKFLPLQIYATLCACVILVLGAFALGAPVAEGPLLAVLLVTCVVSWVAPRFGK